MQKGFRFRATVWVVMTVFGMMTLAACGGQVTQSGGAGGSSSEPKREVIQLTVGTTNSSSSFYAYWAALAQAVNEQLKGDIQLNIVESGSTVDNLNRMARGEFDFGNSALGTVYQAYAGQGAFEGDKQMPELRWFWSYAKMPYLIAVRQDSGITSVEELAGKPFSGGDIGSGSYVGIKNVLNAIKVEPDWIRGSFSDAATAMKNRQAVGMSKLVPGVSSRESIYMDVMTSTKVRFLGLSPDYEQEIQKQLPIYTWYTIPANTYDGQDYAVRTWGDMAGGTVNSKLPQDVGYRIVKAVMATIDQQVAAFPAATDVEFHKDLLLSSPAIPLHAGTVQYLKEQGIDVPQHLIPPEYQP